MDGRDVNLSDPIPPTIAWVSSPGLGGAIRLIDQRALPGALTFIDCHTVAELCEAISGLAVRGAPALGAAGAFGVALAGTLDDARAAAERLVATRPTAVNLAWGAAQAVEAFERGGREASLTAAKRIADDDVAANRALGAHGAGLLDEEARVYTHCNTGSLACVGYGTALGVIRAAADAGRGPRVWVGETRPVLQGARLTAWELDRLGIEARLVADGAAGALMDRGEVDVVIVGADRIAANGDVANKIGTYGLAVLADHHGVPFYVAAPTSTIDLATPTGREIRIEERPEDELRIVAGTSIVPTGFPVYNPAFDVTPARVVTALITERGILRPPFDLPALLATE